MGDTADLMLEGHLCQTCGVYLPGSDGYPRSCQSCSPGQSSGLTKSQRKRKRRTRARARARTDQKNECKSFNQLVREIIERVREHPFNYTSAFIEIMNLSDKNKEKSNG